jgi:hypothetical protein
LSAKIDLPPAPNCFERSIFINHHRGAWPPDSRYLNLRQLVGSLNIALRGRFLEPENCQRLIGFASLSRQVMQTKTALR